MGNCLVLKKRQIDFEIPLFDNINQISATTNKPAPGILAKYQVDTKVLGHGKFGKVFLASAINDPSFRVAIKVISKNKVGRKIEAIREEIRVLQLLDHPNIVKYYETFETNKFLYIVMEYLEGGQLYQKITSSEDNAISEKESACIMKQLLRAINHCHAQNIVHRDIKPENILLGGDNTTVKLIDFGLSKVSRPNESSLKTVAGTPYYTAPEVIRGKYGIECDLWSLGVILYILLCGYMPFSGESTAHIHDKICNHEVVYGANEWANVSREAKDLVSKLLRNDPKTRYTAAQALNHPWINQHCNQETNKGMTLDIIKSLRLCEKSSKLEQEVKLNLVKLLSGNELFMAQKQYDMLDIYDTGKIDSKNLEVALGTIQSPLKKEFAEEVIKKVDHLDAGYICYSQCVAELLDWRSYLTESRAAILFKLFDCDTKGYISADDIQLYFKKKNVALTIEDTKKLIQAVESSNEDFISFHSFSKNLLKIEGQVTSTCVYSYS